MNLTDNQFMYRGLVFGVDTPYFLQSLAGLEDLNVRVSDRELPRDHGSVPGPHYASAKDVVMEFKVVADRDPTIVDPGLVMQRVADLRRAFGGTSEPSPLTFKRPGMPERLINVTPVQVSRTETVEDRGIFAFPRVALTAADPRIYSTETELLTLAKHEPGGTSLDYPEDYPKDFGGGGGEVVAVNDGSADAYPLVRFYGPTDGGTVTSVALRNVTTGQTQRVVTTVSAGQILTVDNEAHVTGSGGQVVGLGGSTRYGAWQQPRVPFALPPGESILRYEAEGTSAETKCVVTWRHTWIP